MRRADLRVGTGSAVVASSVVSESDLSEREEEFRVGPVEMRSFGDCLVVDETAVVGSGVLDGGGGKHGRGERPPSENGRPWSRSWSRSWRSSRWTSVPRRRPRSSDGSSSGLGDAGVRDSIVDVVGVGGEFELLNLGLSVS